MARVLSELKKKVKKKMNESVLRWRGYMEIRDANRNVKRVCDGQ